jgi:profilin
MTEVVAGLTKPDDLYANGLHVAGDRYVLTKAEDRSLYARKVRTYTLTRESDNECWVLI